MRVLVIMTLLVAGVNLHAQQGNAVLLARVIDANTSAPVANTEVTVEGTPFHAISDSLGVATISGISQGEFSIRARHIGFGPTVVTLRFGGHDTLTATLLLHPTKQTLPTVSVVDSTDSEMNPEFEERLRRHIGGYFVTAKELDRAPAATITEILVRKVPGLRTHVDVDGSVAVFTQRDGIAAVFLDGIELSDRNAGIVNLHELSGIEYYPMNYIPVQYRIHSGGVLLLWTRR